MGLEVRWLCLEGVWGFKGRLSWSRDGCYGVKGRFSGGFEGRGGWGVSGELIVWRDVVGCRTGGRGRCLGEIVGLGCGRWWVLGEAVVCGVGGACPSRPSAAPHQAPWPDRGAAAAFARGRPAALRRPRWAGPPCGCSVTAPSSGRWISPTRRSWWGASAATAGASGRAAPTTAGCRAR